MSEQYSPPPPVMAASGPSGPRASFLQRLGAAIIDSILLAVVYGVLYAALKTPGYILGVVIAITYYAYFEGGPTGQTLGKRALGIRVYDFTRGGPIGYGRGVGRYFARIISAIPCLLGYFWMLWDKEKQCWHDKLVTDVVVPVSAYPVERK